MEKKVLEEEKPTLTGSELESASHSDNASPVKDDDEGAAHGHSNSDREDEVDNLEHGLEENIRDLCMLRQKMPLECAQLLEEALDAISPNLEKIAQRVKDTIPKFEFDEVSWQRSMKEFETWMENFQDLDKSKKLPEDFKALEERCKELMKLEDVRMGMGLNDTRELLYSGSRKAEVKDTTTGDSLPKRVARPNCEELPSLTSPIAGGKEAVAKGSLSKIPRLVQDPLTPATPASQKTKSLRKRILKQSVGKS